MKRLLVCAAALSSLALEGCTSDPYRDHVVASGATGAVIGAGVGAVAGSVIPGIGTGAGAVVGGVLGGTVGAIIGRSAILSRYARLLLLRRSKPAGALQLPGEVLAAASATERRKVPESALSPNPRSPSRAARRGGGACRGGLRRRPRPPIRTQARRTRGRNRSGRGRASRKGLIFRPNR